MASKAYLNAKDAGASTVCGRLLDHVNVRTDRKLGVVKRKGDLVGNVGRGKGSHLS